MDFRRLASLLFTVTAILARLTVIMMNKAEVLSFLRAIAPLASWLDKTIFSRIQQNSKEQTRSRFTHIGRIARPR